MMTNWYVLRTNIKCEDKAERNLRAAGFRTYAPWQRFEKFSKRRQVFIRHEVRLVQRYLFLETEGQVPWAVVRACEGVERVINTQGRPIRLGPQEVIALTEIMKAEADFAFDETRDGKLHRKEIGKTKKETTRLQYPVGSQIFIKDGPFAAFGAQVVNVNGRGHLKALVNIFGRLSEIELEPEHVELAAA